MTSRQGRSTGAALALAVALTFAAPGCARIVEDSSGTAVTAAEAGPFPEDYEGIVRRWAIREISRMSSVEQVEVPRPNPGFWDRAKIMGGPVNGWVTTAQIRGKDRTGMDTGRVTYQLLLREGEVVESRYQP